MSSKKMDLEELRVLLLLCCVLCCLSSLPSPAQAHRRSRRSGRTGRLSVPVMASGSAKRKPSSSIGGLTYGQYTVKYFTQRLDHFNVADGRTFQQRYLVYEEQWDGRGPIFLYTGNEGDITMFSNNTGFMYELAWKFKGLLVFIEHRYYGETLPFGPESYKDKEHLGYLTAEQALADYALLITQVKESIFHTSVPVIAIGGSYGGMLAAWMRMKYPHIVIGALAASAPIWWFSDLTPCNSASLTITHDFEEATPGWPDSTDTCSKTIRKSWDAFSRVATQNDGLEWLSDTFTLCKPLANATAVSGLMDWVENTWFDLAMVDYPSPSSFLAPLPAWPVNKTCQYLSKPFATDQELLEAIAESLSVYYNYTGLTVCNDLDDATASLGEEGWDFQACTEMVMPMCSDGVTDMFRPNPWNLAAYSADCLLRYGVVSQPHIIETFYGGKDISMHSNILFSNGLLDPWHGGGVLETISDTLVALIIPNGAHHLDLRASEDSDPPEVTSVREEEIKYMTNWISQN